MTPLTTAPPPSSSAVPAADDPFLTSGIPLSGADTSDSTTTFAGSRRAPVRAASSTSVARGGRARILEEDPDLAGGLSGQALHQARAVCLAPTFEHSRGPWSCFPAPDSGALGVLVLDGMIVVRVETGARAHLELLGEGDLISPWVRLGGDLNVTAAVSAQVVAPVRMALLDRTFSQRASNWPEIHSALMHRVINRSRRASLQCAINAIPRMDERLELTLWGLADRFGRVTLGGIELRLPLTIAQLAEIVAAQRPSVSVAVARLEAQGRLSRPRRGHWQLLGSPPLQLAPLAEMSGLL
jgi:CRP/FNR family cyclic AMP-dependent transcriptional regulator